MKKTNNKGFSLVELIVVVAIMAVLMVVVGPQLLKNVDKARIQRDNSAISEIANAAKIAMADQPIYDEINKLASKSVSITFDTNNKIVYPTTDAPLLAAELAEVAGSNIVLNSGLYKGAHPTLVVEISGSPARVVVKATGMYKNDGKTKDGDAADGNVTF